MDQGTTLLARLAEEGIKLDSYEEGQHYATCPQCSEERKASNRRKQCLSVKVDNGGQAAVYHCNHCEWAGSVYASSSWRSAERKTVYNKPKPIKQTGLHDKITAWFKSRGISTHTLTKAKVRQASKFFPQLDKEINCIAFDYWQGGEVVSRKYRSITTKDFCQDAGCKQTFYGWDDVAKETKILYIVEGELDKLSLNEIGIWDAVSVPGGAGNLDFLADCEELLEGPDRIVLACDFDEPGMAMMEELARRLGKERCYRVHWPRREDGQYCKDANEVLADLGDSALRTAIEKAEGWPIADIHTIGDFMPDVMRLYRGEVEQPVSTGFKNLDEHWRVKAGDVTVITGIPNSGKSEFQDALALNLADLHGWPISFCSFENPPADHIAKLIEKRAGAPFYNSVAGYPKITEFEINKAAEWLGQYVHFIRSDDPDDRPPSIEWIINRAIVQVRRYGVRVLVIDPYNEISSNRPTHMSETEYISYLLSIVKRFSQTYGVHTFVIAHPTKLQAVDGVVIAPGLYDIAGSAHWANKCDNGLTVHRSLSEAQAPFEVHVKKVRWKHVGRRGGCALFNWQPWNGRFLEAGERLSG